MCNLINEITYIDKVIYIYVCVCEKGMMIVDGSGKWHDGVTIRVS